MSKIEEARPPSKVDLGLAMGGLAASLLWLCWAQWPALVDFFGGTSSASFAAAQSSVAPHRWWPLLIKQISQPPQGGLLQSWPISDLLIFLFWMPVILVWGEMLRRLLAISSQGSLTLLAVHQWVLGLIASGLLLFVIGSFYVAPWLILLLGILSWVMGARIIFQACQRRKIADKPRRALRWNHLLLPAFLVLVGFGIFLAGGTPPIQSDGLRYHLGAPQEWLKQSRIAPLPLNAFSAFPFLPGMQYLAALGLGSSTAPAWFHALAYLAASILSGLVASRCAPPSLRRLACCLAVLLVVTVPAGLVLASWPFIDHFTTLFLLYGALGLVGLVTSNQSRAPSRAPQFCWMVGLGFGAALSTKYTAIPQGIALILAGGLLPAFVMLLRRGRPEINGRFRLQIRWIAPVVLGIVIVGSPWYLRNALALGNPLYPAMAPSVGWGDWSQQSAELYRSKLAEKGDHPQNVGVVRSLLRPLIYSHIDWPRFEGHLLGAHGVLLLGGGLLLTFGLFLRLARAHSLPSRTRALALLTLWAWGIYGVWCLTYQSNRMLLTVLALLAPLVAVQLAVTWKSSRLAMTTMSISLVLVILHGAGWMFQWTALAQPQPPTALLFMRETRASYARRAINYLQAYERLQNIRERTEPGSFLALHHGEHRIFGAQHPALWSDWFDTPVILSLLRSDDSRTSSALLRSLRTRGVTHVFVHDQELAPQLDQFFRPRFKDQEWAIVEELFQTLPLVERQANRYRIFAVPSATPEGARP
jgi:hypothetical protein